MQTRHRVVQTVPYNSLQKYKGQGTRGKRVQNITEVQEVYYVEQVLRLRKAQNYTGTKWYRGGTENMAGTHRYLYTGTYIGTSIYPYIYPHIHRYLHI